VSRFGVPRALPAALAAGTCAALLVFFVKTTPVVLEPGRSGWQLVRGASDGRLAQRSVAVLPGVERSSARQLRVTGGGGAGILVTVDGGAAAPVRLAGEPVLIPIPAARAPGVRVEISPLGDPVQLARLEIAGGVERRRAPVVLAFVLALAAVLGFARVASTAAALSLGLVTASLLALVSAPALLWLTLPVLRAVALVAAVALSLGTLARLPTGARRLAWHASGLAACVVFGAFVRGYFLPSTGAWDTEYWKAWSEQAVTHGVTQAYGDANSVPPGHFLAQLRGEEPRFQIEWRGRRFTIDYPPLALLLWKWSSGVASRFAGALEPDEVRSVAVKLPAVAGDLLAVPALLWVLRRRPLTALWCAALYWALPVSWLSSAVLGFLDGSFAPLLLLAVAAAGEGLSLPAGAVLALACLVKPTSGLVAPAMVVALMASRASVVRAVAAGCVVVAVALLPFVLAGTLQTAIVHCYRILFQERLAGGYPNPWWLIGHALTLGPGGWSAPVQYARIELLPLPARPLGTLLFAVAAIFICIRQRGRAGSGPALLSAAMLFFAYGMLAVGVHENHPHPLFLLLLGTGLLTRRLRVQFALASLVYVLNMLAVSGIGRFHGLRSAAIEPLLPAVASLRMALGFDITLLLSLANAAVVVWMLVDFDRAIDAMSSDHRSDGV
jgi:hypothetical protein